MQKSTTDKSPHQPLPHTITLASLVKGEVLSPKKFGRLPEGLPHQPSPRTNPSKNRTIPLAFRRMSVCVCLVGFASLQSPWAHTLRHPCLACSSRCTEYCHSHNNCKKTIIPRKSPTPLPPLSKVRCCRPKKFERLPEGLLAPLRFAPHSYRPLSKVRCCRPKKFGRLPEGLSHLPYPFRFSDTSVNNLSFHTQPSQNRTIPRKSPTPLPCIAPSPLPPLEKGEVS